TGTNLPSAQVGVGFNHSVPVQSVTARGVRMSGRISYFRLTVPVRAFCLYGLVAGLAPAYGAMVFPPDPDPNNLNAFSLFLTEQESVDYYRRAAGTPLMPITGLLVGGGVRYDLDQIAPNLTLTAGDLVLNDPGTPTPPAMRSDILRFDVLAGETRVHTVMFL